MLALGDGLYVLGRLTESPPRPVPTSHIALASGLALGTFLFLGIVFFVANAADRSRALARCGRVEFRELGVFLTKAEEKAGVRWAEIAGFTDASSDFVQLLTTKRTFPAHLLTVPTPTEKDRVAVLELLDRHGLRRLE